MIFALKYLLFDILLHSSIDFNIKSNARNRRWYYDCLFQYGYDFWYLNPIIKKDYGHTLLIECEQIKYKPPYPKSSINTYELSFVYTSRFYWDHKIELNEDTVIKIGLDAC